MRRTRVVIQSRLDSSRLPGKAMLTLRGMPLIELVARRAARSGHEVVVATSTEHFDDRIADHLQRRGIAVVRGPLDDVLARFVVAAAGLGDDDRVVRLTGDNPCADADLVDELLEAMDASGHRYGRVDIEAVPEGLGAEGFTAGALRDAARHAAAPYDREHVTPWLRRELGELLFVPTDSPDDLLRYRATVDVLADYDRVVQAFAGVDDPVAVPWRTLLARIGSLTRTPSVARDGGTGVARVVPRLGSHSLTGATARAVVAAAVESGMTHVLTQGSAGFGERAVRAGLEPAYTQRLAVWMEVAAPAVRDHSALAFEAEVERRLAILGRRRVDALVVDPGDRVVSHPDLDPVWERARAYVAEGVAATLGVRVPPGPPPADSLRDVGISLSTWPAADESVAALPRSSSLLQAIEVAGVPVVREVLEGLHADVAVVGVQDAQELREAVALAASS